MNFKIVLVFATLLLASITLCDAYKRYFFGNEGELNLFGKNIPVINLCSLFYSGIDDFPATEEPMKCPAPCEYEGGDFACDECCRSHSLARGICPLGSMVCECFLDPKSTLVLD